MSFAVKMLKMLTSAYNRSDVANLEAGEKPATNIGKLFFLAGWGNIVGGYVRPGNLSGVAMVTIQISVAISTTLSQGINYTINGFPIPVTVYP